MNYFALLSQSGTDDPTASVKVNTLGGEIAFTRLSQGVYRGTLPATIPADQIAVGVWQSADTDADGGDSYRTQMSGNGQWFDIYVKFGGDLSDSQLSNTPIEIVVYPE